MPPPLSIDLRWRIIMLYYLNMSEIADLLVVCTKTVRRIIKLFKGTRDVQPQQQRHGTERILDALEEMMLYGES